MKTKKTTKTHISIIEAAELCKPQTPEDWRRFGRACAKSLDMSKLSPALIKALAGRTKAEV